MRLRLASLSAALLLLAYPIQSLAEPAASQPAQMPAELDEAEAMKIIMRALRTVRENYVDQISTRELAEAAVGAISSRDPWSRFLDPAQYEAMQDVNAGAGVGIGIRFRREGDGFVIAEVFPDTPAYAAGLQPNDRLVSIDGQPLEGMEPAAVGKLLRGDEGSAVTIAFGRNGAERLERTLARETLTIPSVTWQAMDGVAYMRIAAFDGQTKPGFDAAIAAIQALPDARGLVLDLRSNRGGLVRAAVHVADALLDAGRIMTVQDRQKEEVVEAKAGDLVHGLPIVVLVNASTASSSEILTAALQENGRALVVGRKTYGKGVIQTTRRFPGGAIKLTTARYLTPRGRSIHQSGIAPDIVIGSDNAPPVQWGARPDPAGDVQMAQAFDLLKLRRQVAEK